jgi:hypothetical protein
MAWEGSLKVLGANTVFNVLIVDPRIKRQVFNAQALVALDLG